MSEWFVVRLRQREGSRSQGAVESLDLSDYGHVHLQDGDFWLVEVALNRSSEFAAKPLDRQWIPLDPPPDGWDRYAPAVDAALERAKQRTLDEPDSPFERPPAPRSSSFAIPGFLALSDAAALTQVHRELAGATPFFYQDSPYIVTSRFYDSSQKTLVADYLGEKLAGYGYSVTFEQFYVGGVPCRNVVATRIGSAAPDEFVVVGAHYDSTSERPYDLAPGADDNASGSSLVMEIARMAANRKFDRSIQFVLFDSEEQGLYGSYHFVSEAVASERVIVAAIIADMVTFYASNYGVIIEGEPAWESLMSIMEANTAAYTFLTSRKDYSSWGSDHVPFQQAGIPAFLAIERDWDLYPYYHTSVDDWEDIQATAHLGFEISQACAATLAEVAGLHAYAVPGLAPPTMGLLVLVLSVLAFANRPVR